MLKKGDIILVAFILLLIIAGFTSLRLYDSSGGSKVAVIKQDNKVIRRIDLEAVKKPEKINVKGDYTEVILVEKGRIRFETANCPNKDCVKTGWLTRKGSTAVCIPNRTIIKIEGTNEKVDGGTY